MIGEALDAMLSAGELRQTELERILYPTWNRTPDEWLARTDELDSCGDVFEALLCMARAADPSDDLCRRGPSPRHGVDDDNAPHDVAGGGRRLSLYHPADGLRCRQVPRGS